MLLTRAIDVEVAKTDGLRLGFFKLGAEFAAQALVKQQLGIAVHVERFFKFGRLAEGVGAAVGGRRGGVQQARALALARFKQAARQAVVVGHHVFAVLLHRVAARAFVKDGLDMAVSAIGKSLVKIACIHIVGDFQVG